MESENSDRKVTDELQTEMYGETSRVVYLSVLNCSQFKINFKVFILCRIQGTEKPTLLMTHGSWMYVETLDENETAIKKCTKFSRTFTLALLLNSIQR